MLFNLFDKSQRGHRQRVSEEVSHALCSPFTLNSFHLNALLKGQLTLNPAHTPSTLLFLQQMIRLTFRRIIFSSQHPSVFPFKRWTAAHSRNREMS